VDSTRALTYGELLQESRRWARWIHHAAPEGSVIYLATLRTDAPALLFGTAMAGASFVPLNYRLKPHEIEDLFSAAGGAAIVYEQRYRALIDAFAATVPTAELEMCEPPEEIDLEAVPDAEAPAVRLFTSGASGSPKLVPLSHDNLASYVLNSVDAGSAPAHEAVLLATPPYHVAAIAGFCNALSLAAAELVRVIFAYGWLHAHFR